MRLVTQLVVVGTAAFVGSAGVGAAEGSWALTLLAGIATAVLSLLAYRWVVRRTEHRDPVEAGRAGAGTALGRGALVGALLFVTVIGAIALGGGYRVDGTGSVAVAAGLVGVMAAAAVTEELLFRGILFRVVEQRLGTWVALALTGVLFGAMHLMNPEATLWGAAAIAIEAGGMLGAAYVATRKLWLPIGLHLGWNLAASGLFGTVVSGNDTPQGLLRGVTSGPALLSGGAFGPEASLYSVLVCVVATAVLLRLARRRGHLVPARRRDRGAVTSAATGTPARTATTSATVSV